MSALRDLPWRPRLRIDRLRRGSGDPTQPTAARLEPLQPTPGVQGELTLLTANLWHDWPRGRRLGERLEAFARLVEAERVDVLMLQEVMRSSALRADEWLAERLGMAYVYARANGHDAGIGFEEGVAVFSRFALADPSVRTLAAGRGRFLRRLALAVRLEAFPLWLFSVHLGLWRRRNQAQLGDLVRWVGQVAGSGSAVIGGDFNASERSARFAAATRDWRDLFREVHPQGDAATFELGWPGRRARLGLRLDYLFLKPGEQRWQPREAVLLDAPDGGHSDHRAVLVRLASL